MIRIKKLIMAEKLCEELLSAVLKDDADFNLWMLDKFKVSEDLFNHSKFEILMFEYSNIFSIITLEV